MVWRKWVLEAGEKWVGIEATGNWSWRKLGPYVERTDSGEEIDLWRGNWRVAVINDHVSCWGTFPKTEKNTKTSSKTAAGIRAVHKAVNWSWAELLIRKSVIKWCTKQFVVLRFDSEIIPTRCNNCVYSSQWLYSTCFGWQFHPSSGVQCCIWPFS